MSVISPGVEAPPVDGIDLGAGPRALWFFKVTCPVCQMAAPVAERLAARHPNLVVGVGQDPHDKLRGFGSTFGTSFEVVSDAPSYPASVSYGLEVVPTLVLVDAGRILGVVESWDRDGYNRVASNLSELVGGAATEVSTPGDGLPSFRPG